MKTFKNKLYAVGLMLCGSVPTFLEQDATALVFIGMIAVPLFFAKENWIIKGNGPDKGFSFYICAYFAAPITENDARKRR